jgi:ATP-dependent DNA ligase
VTTTHRFIQPCRPIPAKAIPAGDGWLHDAKFDGYRAQLHKVGSDVVIFSKHGYGLTMRFQTITDLLRALPAKSVIIDAEIVAKNRAGVPDFFRVSLNDAPWRLAPVKLADRSSACAKSNKRRIGSIECRK